MHKKEFLILIGIVLLGGFLRFFRLESIPHGLYFDEVSIGYNAWSILTHGVDQYGISYPLWFQAFGEYKLPIYIYLTAGAIKFFGTTDFAVRFFSALFGTLSIISLYFLVRELVRKSSVVFRRHSLRRQRFY